MGSRVSPRRRGRCALVSLAAAAAAVAPNARVLGAAATFDGDAAVGTAGDNATWATAANWTTGGVVDTAPSNAAPGDDLTFGGGTAGGTIDLGANRVANSLTFNRNYTLGLAATTLVLTNTTGNVSVSNGVTGQVNAVLAGSAGLAVSGGGTLQLNNAANTFTGNITVDGTVAGTALAFLGQGNNATASLGAGANKKITLTNGGILRPVTAAADPSANSKEVVIGTGGGTIDTPVTLTLNDAAQFSGTGDLTKTGTGTLILGQASTGYAGFTGAVNLTAGTIQAFNASSLGTTAAGTTITNAAVLDVQGVTAEPVTISGTNAAGSLVANAGTGAVGAVTLTVNGTVGGAGTLTLGAVGESSAGLTLTKVGTGTTVLSAANTYTGTTTVSAGILQAAKTASLPGYTTGGRVTVAAASTLVLNAGGSGEFTAADLDAAQANVTFAAATSAFGIDTTNAGGTFAYNSTITGAKGFGKFGTGTLTLGGTNTFTGTLTVSGGATSILDLGAIDLPLASGTLINGTGGVINGTGGGRLLLNVANGDIGSSGTLTINAVIANGTQTSPDFFGGGTVVLTANNTFTGTANIQNNIVSVATIGPAGSAAPLGTNATVNLGSGTNTGTLRYTGTGETVTRTIALTGTTGGGTLDQSGTGPLKFNAVTFTGSGVKTLTLTGSGTGAGEIAANVVNNASATGVFKSGSTTWTLSGTNTYTGPTTINQGTLSLGTNNFTTGTTLLFGNAINVTTTGTLDLSGASATFSGLATVQTNSATANVVTVGSGKTLTLGGGLTVGFDNSAANLATQSKLTVSGAGAFAITGGSVQLGVSQGTVNATNTSVGTLDLSGLTGAAGFTATVTNFNVGQGNDVGGTALLTNTANAITATTVNVGNSNGNNQGGNSLLTLGTGTNVIKADTINIGLSKATGTVNFASQAAGSPGSVTITNKAGTGAANIAIGDNGTTNTGAVIVATLDLRGHQSTVTAGALTLGIGNNTSSGSTTGTLNFDTGTFTANSVNAGSKAGTAGTGTATGNINVGGGSFTVNAGGSFVMGTNTAATGAGAATLAITGGTVTSNVNITRGGGTATTAVLTLNGGTLDMTGKTIGGATAATALTALNFQSGTLQNVGEINNGVGGLTKTTAGTLLLNGTNTYTGGTTVNAGTLGGTGSIAGPLTVNPAGTLAPGASIGTFTVAGPVTFGNTGAGAAPTFAPELAGGTDPTSDLLALTGTGANGVLNLSNPDALNLLPLAAVGNSPVTYTIASFASETGVFDTVLVGGQPTQNSNPAGANYALVTYNPTNIQVTVANVAAVPEPAAAGALALAGLGLLARRRRRRA